MPREEAAHRAALSALIAADEVRLPLLRKVADLDLPDCWVGAGFVRSAVWDNLHGRPPSRTWDDIDVVWFHRNRATQEADEEIEVRLTLAEPSAKWSVTNQARMHSYNGEAPCRSAEDAISRWPETATAAALRLNGDDIEIVAPHGLDDLFSLAIRPTPAFIGEKFPIFRERVRKKRWLERWPRLTVVEA